jgi:PAS domain S-box-containing protein
MANIEPEWGILLLIAVILSLSIGVLGALVVHSRKIRAAEYKYRLLFDRVLAPIILVDHKCRIISFNRAFISLLKYDENEVRDLSLENFIPRENWEKLQAEIVKCLASDLDYHGETRLLNKSHQPIQVEISFTMHKTDHRSYLLASFRNINAHKEAELAFREKNAALNEVLAHLEEEKLKYKIMVAEAIDQTITPLLGKIIKEDGTVSRRHFRSLEEALNVLAVEAGGLIHAYRRLTPREVEICNLIKGGATSKEVARALDISILTVNKHRERIRKKLVLIRRGTNLSSYLRQN